MGAAALGFSLQADTVSDVTDTEKQELDADWRHG